MLVLRPALRNVNGGVCRRAGDAPSRTWPDGLAMSLKRSLPLTCRNNRCRRDQGGINWHQNGRSGASSLGGVRLTARTTARNVAGSRRISGFLRRCTCRTPSAPMPSPPLPREFMLDSRDRCVGYFAATGGATREPLLVLARANQVDSRRGCSAAGGGVVAHPRKANSYHLARHPSHLAAPAAQPRPPAVRGGDTAPQGSPIPRRRNRWTIISTRCSD